MKAMVGLVLAILLIFGFRLFWPTSEPEMGADIQSNVLNQNKDEHVDDINSTDETSLSSNELSAPSDEEKTKLMQAEFEILEQARKNLKSHIGRLKHEMWGLKFQSGTAREISTTVMGANKLLKNPHMLGAFSSVEQIKDEVAKVNFAEKSLEEVDALVAAKLAENVEKENQANSATQ